ncbi:4'-phosphopantetheinyl transferase [Clostridium beijerinckii]|uniref:4'-phosphopantetheinyl transferase family protein n=1 Tax=Clostridium beijerinckii TaxID=1520 RepID=UPI0014942E34|nr:4'-phosphopantetheinyl transferase superfamily protein [Clostridium beijerinckii]NOW90760.1 4'-phosphopantetheinyl transferase [Clostridium beijerinckii]
MNLKKIVIKDIEQLGSNSYLDFDNEELYLYLSSIKNISEPQKLYNYLSISEIEKANNFKFEEDTFRFILGHSLTRSILGKYLGIFPSKLTFKYGDSGKPQLENTKQNIFFNISHSNEFVAIIFSKIRLIGVDIEHIDKNKENEKIVSNFFNKNEIEEYFNLKDSQKIEAFYRYWTCKEAYVKAIGKGLSCSFKSFNVSNIYSKRITIKGKGIENERWNIKAFDHGEKYVGAVAFYK